ncbi:MAG TPA: sucrase ferredoxin [Streptosporangiaceae bacterium]|nr:sucrase ferredoxin [Streptosporangiaceae bacterium]
MTDTAPPRLAGGPACSTRSLQAGDPVAGSASYGRRWLLLEVAGAWGPNAFRQSPELDPALGSRIEHRAAAEGFRLIAIRRPGRARRAGGQRWRWARVDCTPGSESIHWGETGGPAEYLTTVFSEPGAPSEGPVIAVCSHGRHDECCATRGRAVAARLAEREGPAVWECSHIGGDRFAATLLLFPHGINYGRADVLDPGLMVDEYRAGRVMLAGLRGRSAYRFLEQTAQHAARQSVGDLRIEAYEPLSSARIAPGHWQVLLAGPPALAGQTGLAGAPGRIRVELAETTTAPLFSNCAATVPLAIPTFAVESVEQLD